MGLGFVSSFLVMITGILAHTNLIEVTVVFAFLFSAAYTLKNYPSNILVLLILFVGFVILFHLIIALIPFPVCNSGEVSCNCVGLEKETSKGSECIGFVSECFKEIDSEYFEIDCKTGR